jgi:lipopolysaccharide/colanic/teichoic acid biosynthesis glycosyltransferase
LTTYPTDNWSDRRTPEAVSGDTYSSITDEAYSTVVTDTRLPLWKRTMDIAVSLFGLMLLVPLFAAVALLIKIVSPGPVFFTQTRVGRFGKTFRFYKLRTMHHNNDDSIHQSYLKELIKSDDDNEKPMLKIKNDSRIIPFGNFLRKLCIDELPQLFNVLKGDMSLVGPRPCIPYEAKDYLHWHARRFDVIPGMTGLWQVNGKNRTSFKEMIRLDIQYALHVTFLSDLFILLKTPLVILFQLIEKRDNYDIQRKIMDTHTYTQELIVGV